ncbi:hypothetical protein B0T19DRAFT_427217 [Cercophora scortea]|uniref:Uncharacterized protein n=1 Tax=Cercophora scortea TaxID=314031 RepID=A0AAE0IF84_9PEZI|nr:hypothetical protein B0T19DRAFT_427217 [Cercophora scortea]
MGIGVFMRPFEGKSALRCLGCILAVFNFLFYCFWARKVNFLIIMLLNSPCYLCSWLACFRLLALVGLFIRLCASPAS